MTRIGTQGYEPLYQVIADVLRRNIASGRLQHGLVLVEGPIARKVGTSRAPVKAALSQLSDEGLVHRFQGRGYLAGAQAKGLEPIRRNLKEVKLEIPDSAKAALEVRGTWVRVYDKVEAEIAACQVFGEFRVIETELADYLSVSRTVARDVLSRLNERGLVRKGVGMHWRAGPLTARALREKFQLRGIVEPAALRLAAPYIESDAIARIRTDITEGRLTRAEDLEMAFHHHCLTQARNETLLEIIRNNRLLLSSVNKALSRLGLPADTVSLDQYQTLFDLIGSRQIDAAAEFLSEHLRKLAEKSIARLKIVALVPETESLPPYLLGDKK